MAAVRLDQRSSPELYVGELLAKFAAEVPERREDLEAYAESVAGGQVEDAIIELLGLPPDDAFDALVAWRVRQEREGVAPPIARRRLDAIRRLVAIAERDLTDPALLAYTKARYGETLGDMLASALRCDAPS